MIKRKTEILVQLGQALLHLPEAVVQQAHHQNRWFTPKNIRLAAENIAQAWLTEKALSEWYSTFPEQLPQPVTVGIIAAGNIPLVGFHDVLCCYVLNLPIQLKTSSKDKVLMEYVVRFLSDADTEWEAQITPRLSQFKKVIATGSNNTYRYFEDYFSKYDALLRKNRTSIAVLNGQENETDIKALTQDITQYFGLGCRNVTHLFIPEQYDLKRLIDSIEQESQWLLQHALYMDNYDYRRTLYVLNDVAHTASNTLLFTPNTSLFSPIGAIHYQTYSSLDEVEAFYQAQQEHIQVVASQAPLSFPTLGFGQAQNPRLTDYADNINTIAFLTA